MTLRKICILLSLFASLLVAVSCNRSVVTGSKLTLSNYDQITTGMTKTQVERILGPPTKVETKDMMIFKKTTYRYEDGKKFAMFTFKNDELDMRKEIFSANRNSTSAHYRHCFLVSSTVELSVSGRFFCKYKSFLRAVPI
jgi:hypothetical protein